MRFVSVLAIAAFGAAACSGEGEFIADEADELDVAESGVSVAPGPLSWSEIQVALPESAHPYANGADQRWTITGPDCARQLRITFDYVDVERGYDYVHVYRGNGSRVASYTGVSGSFQRTVQGSTAILRLTSDRSITGRGFKVRRVEAYTPCQSGYHCGRENNREVCISDIDRCATVRCAAGTECVNEGPDVCIPSCNGFQCGPNEMCVLQQVTCIRAPCYPVPTCQPTLTCASVLCIEGTHCEMVDNRPECVPNPDACAAVRCAADTHCEVQADGSAACVPNVNPCMFARCTATTHCEVIDGGAQCVPNVDPCAAVRCASGTRCEVIDGGAQCVPVTTCAAILCAVGTFCEDLPDGAVCTERPFVAERADFGTANPYSNNQRLTFRAASTLRNAVQIRLHFSRFDLEEGYDFVIIQNAAGREVARYTGNRGAFTTDIFDGSALTVLFTSDASVTRSGFRVDRIESR